jgi:hypothetical protein
LLLTKTLCSKITVSRSWDMIGTNKAEQRKLQRTKKLRLLFLKRNRF